MNRRRRWRMRMRRWGWRMRAAHVRVSLRVRKWPRWVRAALAIGFTMLSLHMITVAGDVHLAFLPIAIAIAAGIAAGAFGATLLTALTIASIAYTAAELVLRDVPDLPSRINRVGITNTVDTNYALPVVYGRAKVGTLLVDAVQPDKNFWADMGNLIMVAAMAHGGRYVVRDSGLEFQPGVAEFESILFHDDEVARRDPDDDADTVYITNDDYGDGCRNDALGYKGVGQTRCIVFQTEATATQLPHRVYLGRHGKIGSTTYAQDFNTAMQYFATTWTANDKGQGIAGFIAKLTFDQSVWTKGMPVITAVILGNYVEDPRAEVSGVNITFSSPDTVGRGSGSFITDGWQVGDKIEVENSPSNANDGLFTIKSVLAASVHVDETIATASPSSSVVLRRWAHPDNGGDNPALCIRDYLLSDIYGFGLDVTDIDETSFADGADYCDEAVPHPIFSGIPRFICRGWVDTHRDMDDNVDELLTSCRAALLWQNGKFRLFITNDDQTPVVDLNEDNIIGDWNFKIGGVADKYNMGIANYVEQSVQHKMTEIGWPAPGYSNLYLSEDDFFRNELTIQLPFTPAQVRAQQIVQTLIKESRQAITATVRCTPDMLDLAIGDLVTVTHDTPGWSAKPFWIFGMELLPDATVNIVLREYDSTSYTYTDIPTPDDEPDTNLPNPRTVSPPSNVALAPLSTQDDRLQVTWDRAYDPFVDYYEIQARHNTSSGGDGIYRTYSRVPASLDDADLVAYVAGVRNGQSWRARVRAVNTLDYVSAWVESDDITVVLHDTPRVTLALTAVANGVDIEVDDFDADGDGIDAVYVKLYVRENASSGGPDPIETDPYLLATIEPGTAETILEPAAAGRVIRVFAVPYNYWGERGETTDVYEEMSGASGSGPTAPPSSITYPAVVTSITFNDNDPSDDTIVRGSGSWITDGFIAGMPIDVNSSSSNDMLYTVQSVTATDLTLDPDDELTDEGPTASVVVTGRGYDPVTDSFTVDLMWTNGDATAQTRVYVNGIAKATVAAGTSRYRITGLASQTLYTFGLRHLKNGVFNPTEENDPVEYPLTSTEGYLGTPVSFAVQTLQPESVKLTWAQGEPGGAGANTIIERSTLPTSGFVNIGSVPAGTNEFEHTDASEAGNTWYFRIYHTRSNWNQSPYTTAKSAAYGDAPSLDNAGLLYTYAECLGSPGGCGTIAGCTSTGSRHLVYWNHTGADDASHHIEIWRSLNGGAYSKIVDNLSVDEVPECGSKPADGLYAFFLADCQPTDYTNVTYRYRVDLRLTSGDTLVQSQYTSTLTYKDNDVDCVL